MIDVEMYTWESLFVIFSLFSVFQYAVCKELMMNQLAKFVDSEEFWGVSMGFIAMCSGMAMIMKESFEIGMLDPLTLFIKLLLLLIGAETVSVKIPLKIVSFCRSTLFKKTC